MFHVKINAIKNTKVDNKENNVIVINSNVQIKITSFYYIEVRFTENFNKFSAF